MKLAEKRRTNKNTSISNYTEGMEQFIVNAYLFCMLGLFPLYYENAYSKIGNVKYEFFWNVSLVFIGISLIFAVIKIIVGKELNKGKELLISLKNNLSCLDYAVLAYAGSVILSYLFSPYKEFAWKGSVGWEMGFCAQMIFVLLYFLISRKKEYGVGILGIHLVASFLTFLFGILHRFEIDPLGMYEGLNLDQKIEFLSTIGQATWFSSYVCTAFAVGVIIFYLSNTKWIRRTMGIYTVVSFGILVTQNSDSAFIAIVGILLMLGYFSLAEIKRWCRFWEIVSLMWGTFAGIGLMQKIFADRAIPLDTLSTFFSQSLLTWVLLAISVGMLYFYKNKQKQDNVQIMNITAKIYKVLLGLVTVAIVAMIIFIYLNTKGYLKEWFGYQSNHQYLLFNDRWGSYRGSTWKNVWKGFLSMSFLQKLFGVGPDCLSQYLYSIPEISDSLHSLWGSVQLTNAHNEYLNSLACYGIVGAVSWLTVLVGGMRYFYYKAKENPFMIAFALCIMGYSCHNIFCYQQVCCTPLLFIVLGIGECLTKSEKSNTIK